MKIKTYASTFVAASLGLMTAIPAHALGLGNLELSSALNEPFQAEISLSSLSENEAGNLQVQLASHEEFERAGLVKSSVLLKLKFAIKQKNGKTVIAVTSKEAVKEPLLDFLLSVTTGNGHLIREYTVLLDPPKSIFREKFASKPVAKSPTQSIKQQAPTKFQNTQPSFTPSTATEYDVRTNDTLWDIALKTRPESSVSVNQMMMALLKENGSAFIRNNINGLKAGQTLSIPSAGEIKQLTQAQALAAVREQNNLWKNRNVKPETVVTEADVSSSQYTTADAEVVAEAPAVEKKLGEPVSRLQLLSPDEESLLGDEALSGPGGEQIQTLMERLTLAQETIDNQALENDEIKERMAAMEEQIQTLRKLVSIQDPSLAKLQGKLEQADEVLEGDDSLEQLSDELLATSTDQEASAIQQELDSEPEAYSNNAVNSGSDDLVADQQNTQIADELDNQASPEIIEEQTQAVEDEANSAVSEQSMAPAEPLSFLDKAKALILENKVESMSAALVLLIGLLLLGRRSGGSGGLSRREKTWDEAVKEIEKDVPMPNFTGSQPVASASVVSEETEVEEVKTVEELIKDADIFVSYGDLDKAKLSLEEARKDEPDNKSVIHKLLFVLFKQGEADQFVELAEKVEAEEDSLEWLEISAWGRDLAPDNELFKEAETEETSEEQTDEMLEAENDSALEMPAEDDVPEFNLDEDDSEPTTPVADDNDDLLAFDPGSITDSDDIEQSELKADDNEDSESDSASDDSATLEFDLELPSEDEVESDISDTLDLPEVSEEELQKATEALDADSENNELEFDLGDIDQVDEYETKLDLASAYIDMGDSEGARNIIEEVLEEGSEEQKSRAQALLDNLS